MSKVKKYITIIEEMGSYRFPNPTSKKQRIVKVRCICGTEKVITIDNFRGTKSCGCIMKVTIPIGEKFERLTVTRDLGRCALPHAKTIARHVECICDCGNIIQTQWSNVRHGNVKSCGCLQSESSSRTVKIMQEKNIVHGDSNKKSGYIGLYSTLGRIRQRCYNENNDKYKWYGGMGIEVCEEWHDYVNFKKWALNNGYRDGLTIDRVDVTRSYCPENCQWMTAQENIDKEYTIDRDRRGRERGESYR